MQRSTNLIKEQQEHTKKLYHDINSHLYTIISLLEQKKRDAAISYVNEVMQVYHSLQINSYCIDPMINAILSRYMDKIKQHNIIFNHQINMDQPLPRQNIDPFIILSFLCDQAISSCLQSEYDKFIELKIKKELYCFYIEISFAVDTNNLQMQEQIKMFVTQMKGIKEQHITSNLMCYNIQLTCILD